MKKLLASIMLPLLCTSLLAEQDSPSIKPISIQAETSTPSATTQKPTIKPKPKPQNAIDSFYRFVRVFLMLLTNQQVQNSLKGIEKLFATLMQTAYQVVQTSKPAGAPAVAPTPKKSATKPARMVGSYFTGVANRTRILNINSTHSSIIMSLYPLLVPYIS